MSDNKAKVNEKTSIEILDYEELKDKRASCYSALVPTKANPVMSIRGNGATNTVPKIHTDSSTFNQPCDDDHPDGYDDDRYDEEVVHELKKCQCPHKIEKALDGVGQPYDKHIYPHHFDLASIQKNPGLMSKWTSNETGWCPNRLEVKYKDLKTLYLAMTENGSMTDSIISVHDTEAAALAVAQNTKDGKDEWSWQKKEYDNGTAQVYVVRYERT